MRKTPRSSEKKEKTSFSRGAFLRLLARDIKPTRGIAATIKYHQRKSYALFSGLCSTEIHGGAPAPRAERDEEFDFDDVDDAASRPSAGRTPRAPRRGSASLRARAAVEGGDKEASPGLSQLASKVTALALAAAMALSSPFEVFASTLTPPPPTPSTSSSASSTSSTPPRSLVVITSTIDYERVARARSAMEKRKKREEAESVALLSDRGATSAGDPSSTSRRRQQDASSELPSPDEADALLQFDRDAYTDDAWEAMKT